MQAIISDNQDFEVSDAVMISFQTRNIYKVDNSTPNQNLSSEAAESEIGQGLVS